MNTNDPVNMIAAIIEKIAQLIPVCMENKEDSDKANGCVAVCILDPKGQVYGRMFGDDKILCRERYRVAWTKASQVWITGIRTGEFEKLAFNNEIDERKFGIRRPDYIGWEGGQPVTLKDGTVLSIGFSGFRGVTDLEIVRKAIKMIEEDGKV